MRKVLLYSILLIAGLIGSQVIGPDPAFEQTVALATMVALSFIMIHVGYEFEIDKSAPGRYAWDGAVAMIAASLPWIGTALYFVFVMGPRHEWGDPAMWEGAFLKALFAAPTSAGVLFSMLAAAGLAATWVFQKARILAIFDDLGTLLLLIPLKIMIVGLRWQLLIVIAIIGLLLWLAWKYLHIARWPVRWPWVLAYSGFITLFSEAIYLISKTIDSTVPIHIEVLLPAFVLGCILARPAGAHPHADDSLEGHEPGPESPAEQTVSTIISALFMVLVGLSMPSIFGGSGAEAAGPPLDPGAAAMAAASHQPFPGWGIITLHVLAVTAISNLGKLFPTLCYRKEVPVRQRLALSIGMFPRGEVGAGVLVISLSYGLSGPSLTVAVLSLALNLLGTGVFILFVKKLLAGGEPSNDKMLETRYMST
jgi:Kef-type K+ transport system membrane component KefB